MQRKKEKETERGNFWIFYFDLLISKRFAVSSLVVFAKVVAKIFLSRRTAILSKVKSYIWNNAPYREKLNAGKIRLSLSLYFKVPLFCDDCGISACRIFAFPPAAADCEMKFYIKLRVFFFFSHTPISRARASLSPLPFPFSLVPSLLLPRSSSPFVYLRTDRSLYWRLHIY